MQILRLPTILLLLLAFVAGCHKAVSTPIPVAVTPPSPPPPAPLPPTITLTADRTAITTGERVTLSWQSSNATTVVLDNAIGNVATSGTQQVNPTSSTSYTATARGLGGTANSAAIRVTVNPAAAARPTAVSRPVTPNRTPTLAEQFQNAMQNILFDYDQASLRPTELGKLQTATQWLIAHSDVRLTIEGNADERGSQEYNIALGDERAAAVKKYLVDNGIASTRLGALTYGEERPLCREQDEGCWQKNRRAQFTMKP